MSISNLKCIVDNSKNFNQEKATAARMAREWLNAAINRTIKNDDVRTIVAFLRINPDLHRAYHCTLTDSPASLVQMADIYNSRNVLEYLMYVLDKEKCEKELREIIS